MAAQSATESFFLAFLVGLHVATALALVLFFRADWLRIIRAFIGSIRRRRIETPDERLAWLLVIGTIPAGLLGLTLEHALRVIFATPLLASVFLVANGVILLTGERLRRRSTGSSTPQSTALGPAAREPLPLRRLESLDAREALAVGVAQSGALLAGISRSGITMVAGLLRGLDHEDAARFSFLLATPIILAAGVYKLPDLLGPNGDGVRAQILVGSLAAGLAAYLSVRFLTRYFRTRTLLPFAIYSLVIGTFCVIRFA